MPSPAGKVAKMKVWSLLSKVEDILKYFEKFAEKMNDGVFDIIIADYVTIEIGDGKDLKAYYKGEQVPLPDAFWPMISNTDCFTLEKMLIRAGVKSIINLDDAAVARSKIDTYQLLASNGIRVPDTIVFFDHPDKEAIVARFGYPFVIKPDSGFGGEGVTLINSEAELDEYISKLQYGTAYVAQEYIATSRGKDVRVILLGGEYLYSSMRSATDPNEFRSNVHVGGELLEYKRDEPTLALCKKVAGLFDLPLIGLDLMFGDGGFVIAEVNASPGLFPDNMIKARKVILQNFYEKESSGK